MNKKFLLAGLIVAFVFLFVFFLRINPTGKIIDNGQTIDISDNISNNQMKAKILISELERHNSQSDCWISYKGKVYDITAFLPRHPGGINAIAKYCGTSEGFENAFTKKHGTSKISLLMQVGTFIGDFSVVGNI